MKNDCRPQRLLGALAAVWLALVVAGPGAAHAQEAGGGTTPLAFDVATVKPVEPGKMVMVELRVYPGGRLIIHALSLREMIADAFDLPAWEVAGGEDWVRQTHFDVEGKPPEEMRGAIAGGEYSNSGIQDARVRSMLQALLVERFHLKYHMEKQPGTVYLLGRGGGPLRLETAELNLYTRSEDGTVAPSHAYPTGDIGLVSGKGVSIHQTSMKQLAGLLSEIEHAPVSDRTGLPDFYNFKSQTIVTDDDFKSGAVMHMVLDAVPEMGLKLVKTDGVAEKFVIDSVEQPAAN